MWGKGGSFADDKRAIEQDEQELSRWYKWQGDVASVHGIEVRPDKCQAQVKQMVAKDYDSSDEEAQYEAKYSKDLQEINMWLGEESVKTNVPTVEAWQCIRMLGELSNPCLIWDDAIYEVQDAASDFELVLRRQLTPGIALRLWETIFAASGKNFPETI